jgi:AcrR family transcriptional regulator
MPRTPKVVEDRRAQILDSAMRVFAQKGFSRATNKDIAHAAGITPGLIYHYFENKEALLYAIIEERSPVAIIRSLPEDMFALPPDRFLRFLLQQVLTLVESENYMQIIRVLLPEILHNPNIAPIGLGALEKVTTFMEKFFRQKTESGELCCSDPYMVSQVFLGTIMGFVLRRKILHDPLVSRYTQEQIADAIIDITFKGLLPS